MNLAIKRRTDLYKQLAELNTQLIRYLKSEKPYAKKLHLYKAIMEIHYELNRLKNWC